MGGPSTPKKSPRVRAKAASSTLSKPTTPSKRQASENTPVDTPGKRNRASVLRGRARRVSGDLSSSAARDSSDTDETRAVCLFPDKNAPEAFKSDDKDEEPVAKSHFQTPRKEDKERRPPGTPSSAVCSPSVKLAYSIVRRCTGSLGGNGSGGAIYGELTAVSMQKVVDLMVKHCDLNTESIFIDIGAGLGKPNIHVAQNPGVAISYGIEHEHVRWQLSLHNLKHLLQAAAQQDDEEQEKISHSVFFSYGDITEAHTLDPFTHVYMFDIGFPPNLFYEIADRFNRSRCSKWLTCYHGPRLIIDRYGFDVEYLAQCPTSMHGSSEGHTAYCYRRRLDGEGEERTWSPSSALAAGDPAFSEGLRLLTRGGLSQLQDWVVDKLDKHMTSPRPVRRRRPSSQLFANEG